MFSYIYADSRGLQRFFVAATEPKIKSLAIEAMRSMVYDEPSKYQKNSDELKNVIAAIHAEDLDLAMKTWNNYVTDIKKIKVAYHKIEEFSFIE